MAQPIHGSPAWRLAQLGIERGELTTEQVVRMLCTGGFDSGALPGRIEHWERTIKPASDERRREELERQAECDRERAARRNNPPVPPANQEREMSYPNAATYYPSADQVLAADGPGGRPIRLDAARRRRWAIMGLSIEAGLAALPGRFELGCVPVTKGRQP